MQTAYEDNLRDYKDVVSHLFWANALILLSNGSEKLFVLGGVYEQALPLADEMILTHLPIEVEGDAYFPGWDEDEWEVVERRSEGELVFATYRHR